MVKGMFYITLGALIAAATPALACVGARPISMGGAFVAAAGGAVAAYWNPAGLAWSDGNEAGWTRTVNQRGSYNYDDFIAVSQAYDGHMAGALSFIGDTGMSSSSSFTGMNGSYKAASYMYSLAYRPWSKVSVGSTFRYEKAFEAYSDALTPDRTAVGFGMDLGIQYHPSNKWSFGLLLQDINKTKIIWNDGIAEQYGINIRPGISYRPDDSTLISSDLYNVGRNILPGISSESTELRIGLEKRLILKGRKSPDQNASSLSMRIGAEKALATGKTVYSGGLGLSIPGLNGSVQFDYAYRYDATELRRDGGVHLLALGYIF